MRFAQNMSYRLPGTCDRIRHTGIGLEFFPSQAILYKPSLAYAVNEAKEGFFMDRDIPTSASRGSSSFRKIVAAFLGDGALPFARILSAERIERVFAKHSGLFGVTGSTRRP